ncbi:Uncharacterized protein BM_BM17106 [Brugia malayi]|uniref:Uncharacterized protein n=1 Tax=Brugia malayi TaxID=6279 RepID=A0A4E9FST9_BRUMA|nr:Uncharacterized protein BM_BM17106 [Brugia malayi]VIO99906.1 Uncharacterized protein BM_BM17106 [Brugia malayi]
MTFHFLNAIHYFTYLLTFVILKWELTESNSRIPENRNEPIQIKCLSCNAWIIRDVRNRWHCLSCISRRSFHFFPACGNVISEQYPAEVIKKNSTSSST